MQLSEEEKRKQQEIAERVAENKPVENLVNSDEPENKERRGYRSGIYLGPEFGEDREKLRKEAENLLKEQESNTLIGKTLRNKENELGCKPLMGDRVEPVPSTISRLIKKIFGK